MEEATERSELPAPGKVGGNDVPLLQELATYVSGLGTASLDDSVWEKAGSCLVDAVGLGIAGTADSTALAAAAITAHRGADRAGSCRLWINGTTAPMPEAVMANAVAVHAQLQDDCDMDTWSHPGGIVVPAAIGAGEATGTSVEQVLRGIVAGYSVMRWLGGGSHISHAVIDHGFRANPTFGPLAASLASSIVFGLSAEQTANALSIACSVAGGLLEPVRSGATDWRFQAGTAAWEGLRAAQLAGAGVVGSADVFESPLGFFRSFTGQVWGKDAFVTPLPVPELILGVWAKPYPTAGDNVAVVLAAESVWQQRPKDGSRIRAVRIHQNAQFASYPGTSFRGPFRRKTQAIVSTAFVVACMLATGSVPYSELDQLMDSNEILSVIECARVVPEADYSFTDGKVEVDFENGDVVVGSSDDMPRTRIFPDAQEALRVFGERVAIVSRSEERKKAAERVFDRAWAAQTKMSEALDDLVA